ncbi:hypothetical protein PTKIN_Ptkin07bG0047200 [Pterospermum kingtungense]
MFLVPEACSSACRIYSENLLSLCNATLNLVLYETGFGNGDPIYMEFNNHGLVDFIGSLRYAKNLQLNFQIIEALSPQGQLPNIIFEHLEHLKVTVAGLNYLDDNDITAIAAFVRCCSSLKTLAMKCVDNANELAETEVVG